MKFIQRNINKIPLLRDNPLSVNLLLLLGVMAFVIITVDLQTEMSAEKDEISAVIGTVNKTTISSSGNLRSLFILPVTEFMGEEPTSALPETLYRELSNDRAPPSLV